MLITSCLPFDFSRFIRIYLGVSCLSLHILLNHISALVLNSFSLVFFNDGWFLLVEHSSLSCCSRDSQRTKGKIRKRKSCVTWILFRSDQRLTWLTEDFKVVFNTLRNILIGMAAVWKDKEESVLQIYGGLYFLFGIAKHNLVATFRLT